MGREKVRPLTWNRRDQRWLLRAVVDGRTVELGRWRDADKEAAEDARRLALEEGAEAGREAWERYRSETRGQDGRRKPRGQKADPVAKTPYPFAAASMGEQVVYRGQKFRCDGAREVKTAKGYTILVDVWASHCATCGQLFTFRLLPPRDGRPAVFTPVRRCAEHKARGKPVLSREMHPNCAMPA